MHSGPNHKNYRCHLNVTLRCTHRQVLGSPDKQYLSHSFMCHSNLCSIAVASRKIILLAISMLLNLPDTCPVSEHFFPYVKIPTSSHVLLVVCGPFLTFFSAPSEFPFACHPLNLEGFSLFLYSCTAEYSIHTDGINHHLCCLGDT